MPLLRKYSLISLLLLSFWNCSKPDEPTPPYVGNWLWEGSSGGIGGWRVMPKANERVVLRFSSDQQFSVYRNDTLLSNGTFRVSRARSIYSGKEESQIEAEYVTRNSEVKNTSPVVVGGIITELSADRLSIGDNFYDGFGSSFVRAKSQ